MSPDQSRYPANSVPQLVRRTNQALQRADQIHHAEGGNGDGAYWFAPIVADAEAGFGGGTCSTTALSESTETMQFR